MKPLPFRLALEPILPSRTPSASGYFEYGFHLRLPNGPGLERNDPLLTAFGASIESLYVGDEQEEALQGEVFEPGRPVRLVPEPFDPEDPDAMGVWDAEGLRQVGSLPLASAAVASAAVESGLEQSGLVLWEHREASDYRRERLGLLLYSPTLVRVRIPKNLRVSRPARLSRPRLVLVADNSGEVRWWDPSASKGPLEASDLALSHELRVELERLRESFAALAAQDDEQHGFERLEAEWEREALQDKAGKLWRHARAELGRRYAVGFLGSRMRNPVWSPSELSDDADDSVETPF